MSNPTNTNQASELYELCKEVYEKTGWCEVDKFWHSLVSHDTKKWGEYKLQDYRPSDLFGMRIVPLYTSDYLLEKLPKYVIEYDSYYEQDIYHYLCVMKVPDGYVALYDGLSLAHKVKIQRTDTPLKALLKLTIALSEAGELK